MPLESATYIDGLVATNPVNATDEVSVGDDHLRLLKSTIKATFPSLTGAVTASQAELNILDGATLSTAELNILDGVTLTAANINDAALKSAINTFTATSNVFSNAAGPFLRLDDAGAGAGLEKWRVRSSAGVFSVASEDNTGAPIENAITCTKNAAAEVVLVDVFGDELQVTATVFDCNSTTLEFAGTIGSSGTPNTSASEVGWKGVPRISKTADHTIVAADQGLELALSSAADDITVQASGQPPEGAVVFLDNATGGSVDIIQGAGMTLTLDGTSTTGSRTLAANGRAYVRFTGSGTAKVGGLGVA